MSGDEEGGTTASAAAEAEAEAGPDASASPPQDGTANSSRDGSALVKNLLFPSYTAAGSSEAFHAGVNNNTHEEADTKGSNHVDESMLTHTGAGSLNRSAASDGGGGHDASMVDSSTAADGGALSPLPSRGSPLVPPTPDADAGGGGASDGTSSPAAAAAAANRPRSGDASSPIEAEEAQGVKSPPKMTRKTTPTSRLRPPTASGASSVATGRLGTNTGTNGSPDRASVSTMHSGASSGILGTKFLSQVSSSRRQQEHDVSSTVSTEVVGNLSQGNAAAAEVSSTVSTNVMHNLSGSDVDGVTEMTLSAENLEKISPPKAASKRPFHNSRGEGDDDGDDTSEANSMTSHMGSEPGDRKLRLEEVAKMEVMAEEDDEEAAEDSSELQQARPARTISTSANVGESDAVPTSSNGSHGVDSAPTKSFLSNAIHRIGSGVSQSIAGRGGAPPTPKTPRSPHPSPRGDPGPQLSASISAILRSPRLSNHGDASGTRNAVLSPRFSSLSSPYRKTSPAGSHHSAAPRAPQSLTLSPFQRAKGCMSFDSSDGVGAVPGRSPPSPSMGMRGRKTFIQHRSSARSPRQSLQQRSRSWDADSEYRYIDNAVRLYGRHESDPVRQQHARQYPRSPRQLTGISSSSAGNAFRTSTSHDTQQQQQQISQRPKPDAVPQRIEIEREDAINLLTCLVERSIAFHDKSDLDSPSASKDVHNASKGKYQAEGNSNLSDTSEALKALRVISENSKDDASNNAASHATRMNALDELLRSQTYAAEMQRAAFSASSWLKATGRSDTGLSEDNQMNISYSYSNSSTGANEEGKTKAKNAATEENGTDQNKKAATDLAKMDTIALRAQLHAAEATASEKSNYAKRLNAELAKCRAEIGRLKSTSRTEALFSSPNKSIFDVEEEDGSSESETEREEGSEIAPKQLESALKDVSAVIDEDESSQAGDATTSKLNTNTAEIDSYVKEIILLKAALDEANTRLGKFEGGKAPDSNTESEGDAGIKDDDDGAEAGDTEFGVDKSNDEDSVDILDTSIIPANLSNFVLEKDLETYRDAIRKAASSEIETLNQELEALKSAVASQTSPPAKSHPKSSPGNKEERMINARMLNAEDFVTEWDPVIQLPPPPDHQLRSPIVYGLLSQWTSDQVMQESLLGWVDNIMAGEDASAVPPLKISSLNHQLRDGFVMHILPLLLRRPDIHVEVTTRAHRRTSYDMAVSITKSMPDRNGVVSFGSAGDTSDRVHVLNGNVPRRSAPSNKQMMAFKASRVGISEEAEDDTDGRRDIQQHVRSKVSDYLKGGNTSSTDVGTGSVANSDVTNRISNLASVVKLAPRTSHDTATLSGPPSADEYSTATGGSGSLRFAQQQGSVQEQPGFIGRAIGLISRSKDEGQPDLPPQDIRLPPSGPSTSRLQMPSLAQEEEEQYHRVVSVPPGKIGITFVQYRGHAMVSDVSPDSPLNGWIFPSDIVIAVDEKAVSGLRVREIVDLLKSRKDRQRALRVISSHDLQDIVAQEVPVALLG